MKGELKKERMEWLDAMRGFTMIMVVAYHVAQISYVQNFKASASLPFLVLFRMPLFFFVSGFLAYKARFVWSASNTFRLLAKKFKIQVFPALVFLCFFIVLRKQHFWDTFVSYMSSATKGGYWFTWALLQMFAVYYLFCFAIRRLSERVQHNCVWGLWAASLIVYEFCYMPKVFDAEHCDFINATGLIQLMRYFNFFVMGNLVHRYWTSCEDLSGQVLGATTVDEAVKPLPLANSQEEVSKPDVPASSEGPVQRLFDSQWFFPVICILAFFCCSDIFRWHTLKFVWTNLPRTVAMYCLLFIVVIFFRHYKQWFSREKAMGRMLQYVGTRTLDVYLIHYFFLPTLPGIGKWLNSVLPNFGLEIVMTLIPAIIVVALCLLVSNILRISPLFSENFFGRKIPPSHPAS